MSKPTFSERCQIAQQLLPDAQYRDMLTALHAEMLMALAEQPAQQNGPWCMKMNGCKTKCEDCPDEVPKQPSQQEPVAKVYRHGKASNGEPWHGVHWFDQGVNMPDGTLLYTAHGITKGNT